MKPTGWRRPWIDDHGAKPSSARPALAGMFGLGSALMGDR
jgi:hypothetical protein